MNLALILYQQGIYITGLSWVRVRCISELIRVVYRSYGTLLGELELGSRGNSSLLFWNKDSTSKIPKFIYAHICLFYFVSVTV